MPVAYLMMNIIHDIFNLAVLELWFKSDSIRCNLVCRKI